MRQLRYSFRVLAGTPQATALAIAAFAVGIGACTIAFSFLDALLLRPLNYQESQRLVALQRSGKWSPLSVRDFEVWQDRSSELAQSAGFAIRSSNWTGVGDPQRIQAALVSAGFLEVLQTKLHLGRGFGGLQDTRPLERTAIVSYGLWSNELGADPEVLGRELVLDDEAALVVGVLPRGFDFPGSRDVKVLLPFEVLEAEAASQPLRPVLRVLARLGPDVTRRQLQTSLKATQHGLEDEFGDATLLADAHWVSLHRVIVGDSAPIIKSFFLAVLVVLTIACANVAGLLAAQSEARRQEGCLRLALGASKWHLARQALTQGLILSLGGGLLALAASAVVLDALVGVIPEGFPRLKEVGLDGRGFLFTLAVAIATAVASGLMPVMHAASRNQFAMLKENTRLSGRGTKSVRSAFLVCQLSLTLVILAVTGLLVRSFLIVDRADYVIDPNDVLTGWIQHPTAPPGEGQDPTLFFRRLLEQVESLHGVEAASLTSRLPLTGSPQLSGITVEGAMTGAGRFTLWTDALIVSPNLFSTLKIPLLSGRDFDWSDSESSKGVAIIDESLAKRFWPNQDPIGKRIKWGIAAAEEPWLEIIGVVPTIQYLTLAGGRPSGLGAVGTEQVYFPLSQRPRSGMSIALRSSADSGALAESMRMRIHELDKSLPLTEVFTMEAILQRFKKRPRLAMTLLLPLALATTALSIVGIYGSTSRSVESLGPEIAVRVALGAGGADVIKLVLATVVPVVAAGSGIGCLIYIAISGQLSGLIYAVKVYDPMVSLGTLLVVAASAALATIVPAAQALRKDPAVVLRTE